MADRIVQLEGGKIVAQGDFESLKATLSLMKTVLDEPGIKNVNHGEVQGDTDKFVNGVNLEKQEEDKKRGIVPLKVYLEYLRYGASLFVLLAVPMLYFSGGG